MNTQQRFQSACASTQSDQSSLSAWKKFAAMGIKIVSSEDFDQTAGWSEFSLGAHVRRYVSCRCGSTSRKHAYIILTPLKPHFYIAKLGFTRVYVIFLISAQNIDRGYSFEPSRRGGSNEYPQSMFWAEIWKLSEIFCLTISFFGGNVFSIFD